MAFWLERILSSKRLVCNRMQTGPISSSFLMAVVQTSEKQTSRLYAVPRVSPHSVNAPPALHGIWHCAWLWAYNQKHGSELKNSASLRRSFRGSSYFFHYEDISTFNSLAHPHSTSLPLVCRQLPKAVLWQGLIKLVELWGFTWGKSSF